MRTIDKETVREFEVENEKSRKSEEIV